MKYIVILCILFPYFVQAQVSSACENSVPTTLSEPAAAIICDGSISLSIASSSNVPSTVEYLITDVNSLATDNLGPVILGSSLATTFDPTDFGVTSGMTFEVTPINYDLTQLQTVIDDLFNNSIAFFTCCSAAGTVIPGLCENLMSGGINSGADIQNFSDVLNMLNILTQNDEATNSIENSINLLNAFNDMDIPVVCGGGTLCYAIDQGNTATYYYKPIPVILSIENGCPVDPTLATVHATVPSGELNYSLDGINYQTSKHLISTSSNTNITIYVQEITCMEVISQAYVLDCSLPVSLVDFEVKKSESGHLLNWTTASEENFDYFDIQRAGENQKFESLHFLSGQGKSEILQYYQFEDEKPLLGENYYRLAMVDLDGSLEYSKVISLLSHQKESVFIFPNPVKGRLFIQLSNLRPSGETLSIFSNTGHLMWRENISGDTEDLWECDTSNWPTGLYFLQVSQEGVQKFLVQTK